jgi:hypothetical protein
MPGCLALVVALASPRLQQLRASSMPQCAAPGTNPNLTFHNARLCCHVSTVRGDPSADQIHESQPCFCD